MVTFTGESDAGAKQPYCKPRCHSLRSGRKASESCLSIVQTAALPPMPDCQQRRDEPQVQEAMQPQAGEATTL